MVINIFLKQDNLHMVHLMLFLSHHLLLHYNQNAVTFLVLAWSVLKKEATKWVFVCCVTFAESEPYCHSILFVCLDVCQSFRDLQPTMIDRSQPNLVGPV